MTKYILCGGELEDNPLDLQEFEGKKLLCICSNQEWKIMNSLNIGNKVNIVVPNKNELLSEQIIDSDIIFIGGDDCSALLNQLNQVNDLAKLFKGKVIIGTHCGSSVLAKHYYDKNQGKCCNGIGVLPIKLISHFDETISESEHELAHFGGAFPVIALHDKESLVITN